MARADGSVRGTVTRRRLLGALAACGLTLLSVSRARSQGGSKVIVIGLLDAGERLEWWEAFKQQMRELGYVEGRNVRYEQRVAKSKFEDLPRLANELVQLKVAVIITGGAAAAVAAKRATSKIPIVMASGADQVSLGLAASLARPGGNVTGVSSLNSELMVKRFELLRETVPKTSRVGALWHADNAASMSSVRDLEQAAASSRVAFQSFAIGSGAELPDAFSAMARERIDALVVTGSPMIYGLRAQIADLALKHKLPAIYSGAEYAEAGGLLSYAASYPELFRHAALYADKILRGANPADMPIEQPTTFELVINERTARAIGLKIPPAIAARANRVIQ